MADPASILALLGASLTITMRAACIGKDLYSLKAHFQSADQSVRQLSVHVSAIRVAAQSLSSWLEEDAVGSAEVAEIKSCLLDVLSACCDLLLELQNYIASALAGAETVGFRGAVSYAWNEGVIKETTQTLHHQEVALLLMLQTLKYTNRREQQRRLNEPANAETLRQAKQPSSSIWNAHRQSASTLRYSATSENLEKLDMTFNFDAEIMASTAYRACFADLLRQNLSRTKSPKPPDVGTARQKEPLEESAVSNGEQLPDSRPPDRLQDLQMEEAVDAEGGLSIDEDPTFARSPNPLCVHYFYQSVTPGQSKPRLGRALVARDMASSDSFF